MSTPSEQTPLREGERSRQTAEQEPARRSPAEVFRTGGMVVLAVLATLFAVFNLKEVKVSWIFGSGHAPLIVVIVISVVAGVVLTYLAERINRRRQ